MYSYRITIFIFLTFISLGCSQVVEKKEISSMKSNLENNLLTCSKKPIEILTVHVSDKKIEFGFSGEYSLNPLNNKTYVSLLKDDLNYLIDFVDTVIVSTKEKHIKFHFLNGDWIELISREINNSLVDESEVPDIEVWSLSLLNSKEINFFNGVCLGMSKDDFIKTLFYECKNSYKKLLKMDSYTFGNIVGDTPEITFYFDNSNQLVKIVMN